MHTFAARLQKENCSCHFREVDFFGPHASPFCLKSRTKTLISQPSLCFRLQTFDRLCSKAFITTSETYYLCNMEISAWKIWRMYLPSGRLFVHPHPVSELDGDARMFFRKASTTGVPRRRWKNSAWFRRWLALIWRTKFLPEASSASAWKSSPAYLRTSCTFF